MTKIPIIAVIINKLREIIDKLLKITVEITSFIVQFLTASICPVRSNAEAKANNFDPSNNLFEIPSF